MSNPHTTDHDQPVPLGPPIPKEIKPVAEPVWKDMRGSPGYQYRTHSNGYVEVKRKDGP